MIDWPLLVMDSMIQTNELTAGNSTDGSKCIICGGLSKAFHNVYCVVLTIRYVYLIPRVCRICMDLK